jgi:hypothetical protein
VGILRDKIVFLWVSCLTYITVQQQTHVLIALHIVFAKNFPNEDDHQTGHTDRLVHCTGAALESFQPTLGYRKHDVCPMH